MSEFEQSFPLQRSLTEGVIKDFLAEFTPPDSLMEIRRIEAFSDEGEKTGSAHLLQISPEKNKKIFFTVDMDDTLVQYTEAKERFHQTVIDKYLLESSVSTDVFSTFLKHINKASRTLPENGVHPEIYNPTLEVLALTQFIADVEGGKYADANTSLESVYQEYKGDEKGLNEWVRNNMILPLLSGDAAVLPAGNLTAVKIDDKTYFQEASIGRELLATAADENEIDLISQKLHFNDDTSRDCFTDIYAQFQTTMFSPEINESIIPTLADGGRFILATFGEPRFQLIKIKKLFESLTKLGARLPDEVLFFDLGRKAPVISHLLSREDDESIRIVHLDNSSNQCKELESLDNPRIHAVLFNPKTDKERLFADLTMSPVAN